MPPPRLCRLDSIPFNEFAMPIFPSLNVRQVPNLSRWARPPAHER